MLKDYVAWRGESSHVAAVLIQLVRFILNFKECAFQELLFVDFNMFTDVLFFDNCGKIRKTCKDWLTF